jgi:hypothetical protein
MIRPQIRAIAIIMPISKDGWGYEATQDVGLTMSPPSEPKQPPKPQPKPPKPKPVKETYRGFLPDDEAIYQDGGFLWRLSWVKI